MLRLGDSQVSVPELQSALEALRRGDFRRDAPRASSYGDASWFLSTPVDCWLGDDRLVVLVLAAHAGAGASTVAVALADVAAQSHTARLVDGAAPARSGLVAAADTELGVDDSGWRLGRRGQVEVHRPAGAVGCISDLPNLRPVDTDGHRTDVVVVDAGWPVWDVLAGSGWLPGLLPVAQLVVVCRATIPGVRQTEQVLGRLPSDPVIAAVGPRRWPGPVLAGCGQRLRAAREVGRVVTVGVHRSLETDGVDARPLPAPVAATAQVLAGHVGVETTTRRASGSLVSSRKETRQ